MPGSGPALSCKEHRLAASPLGKESRVRILRQHFAQAGAVTPSTAWQFVYHELLWIDGSTGLAHLYESDKAQPGRLWYGRTMIFTDMLCERFGNISREQLKVEPTARSPEAAVG
jgi:hypothetical protein